MLWLFGVAEESVQNSSKGERKHEEKKKIAKLLARGQKRSSKVSLNRKTN